LACFGTLAAACRTAILGEIPDQPIHGIKVGAVYELAANASLRDQSRTLQVLQMKRQ